MDKVKKESKTEDYILVVDDNRINRRVIKTLLQRKGIESLEASNGFDAVSMAKENKFTMILMDILMPGIDGYETTKKIRELNNYNSNIPIIAVTADDAKETKSKVFDCGMNGYIIKPLNNESVEEIVLKYIKQIDKEDSKEEELNLVFNEVKFNDSYEDLNLQIEIIETFINEYQEGINSIKKAYTNKDVDEIHNLMLYYKGSFGALKAEKIDDLTEEIINKTNTSDFNMIKTTKSLFITELETLFKELKKYLKQIKTEN